MAVSEHFCGSTGRALQQNRADASSARLSETARWHLAAARGEIQRAAAVTAAGWTRARDVMFGLLYDN
jgi:hypothetical protein